MEEDLKVLMKADPDKQESLLTEVIPDPMEGEQTWPTEEELSEAQGWYWQTLRFTGPRIVGFIQLLTVRTLYGRVG